MRICFICSGFGEVHGGAQRQLSKLIYELSGRGCQIYLLSRRSITTRTVPHTNLVLIPDFFASIRILSALSFILFSMLWITRNRRNIDIIHAIQMYSNTTIGVLAKIFFRIPVVTKITATNELGEVSTIKKLPFSSIRMKLLNRVDRFIAITSQTKHELLAFGIEEPKIASIPNGVLLSKKLSFNPEDKQMARAKLGIIAEKTAIYLGRFSEEKNIDIALLALAQLKKEEILGDFKLLLVGGGGDYRNIEDKLKNIIATECLDQFVHFIPSVENVYDYLVASNIFVLLSTSEGLSNALLEAMACGSTILATDIDANRDLLKNGHNSLLVKVRSVEETAQAFRIFIRDGVDSEQFGKNARIVVEKNYSMPAVAKKHLDLYHVVTNK